MEEIINHRFMLQLATLVLSVLSFLLILWMIYKDKMPWRYAFLPLAILLQLILFYSYVVVLRPPTSATGAFWSAVIRMETVFGFFIGLWSYFRK